LSGAIALVGRTVGDTGTVAVGFATRGAVLLESEAGDAAGSG
jgi:hypothetical protein